MRLPILLLLAGAVVAQTPTQHKVTLAWADTVNPAGTTYNVYRAPGACSGTPTYAKIAGDVAAKTYEDIGVATGNYCYAVTAQASGMESDKSVPALAAVPPFAPDNLSIKVEVTVSVTVQ